LLKNDSILKLNNFVSLKIINAVYWCFLVFPITIVRPTMWTGADRGVPFPTRETLDPVATSLNGQRWFLSHYLLAGIFILALTGAQIWLKRV
jgi:hypothetical protein